MQCLYSTIPFLYKVTQAEFPNQRCLIGQMTETMIDTLYQSNKSLIYQHNSVIELDKMFGRPLDAVRYLDQFDKRSRNNASHKTIPGKRKRNQLDDLKEENEIVENLIQPILVQIQLYLLAVPGRYKNA